MDAINQLIQTRMDKNLTLEQVAQDTKIPIHYLQAIESYQLNKLPKSKLTTMYLSTYAQYLDLSPEPILELFDKYDDSDSYESTQSQSTESRSQKKTFIKMDRTKWLWLGLSLGGIVFIGVGWFVVSLFISDEKETGVQELLTNTNESKEVSSVSIPTAKDRAKMELIEPIESNEKYDRYQLSNVEKIELVVTAKEQPTSIEVGGSDQAQMEKKTLQANEKAQFTDQQSLSIRIERPSHVHVSVNGITVEPSDPSQPASYRFELRSVDQ